jgi:hypothetical protein
VLNDLTSDYQRETSVPDADSELWRSDVCVKNIEPLSGQLTHTVRVDVYADHRPRRRCNSPVERTNGETLRKLIHAPDVQSDCVTR